MLMMLRAKQKTSERNGRKKEKKSLFSWGKESKFSSGIKKQDLIFLFLLMLLLQWSNSIIFSGVTPNVLHGERRIRFNL